MADTIAGYPTSGLERFVGGFQHGYENMTDIRKKSAELKEKLAFHEAAANKPAKGVEDTSDTTREGAYDTGGTTGSGGGSEGGGGSGGSVSSFDPKQTGTGHVAPKSERIEYYNQLAKEYGLNAQAILMTIDKEGLHSYVGDNGKSFGDFQMYTGGGMGNEALKAGINIRDPNTWKEQGRYAIQQMAANKGNAKWFAGQWHGPANHAPWAVSNFSNPDAVPPGSARPMSAGSSAPVPGAPVQVGGRATGGAPGSSTSLPPRVTLDVNGNPQLPVGDATREDLDRAYDYDDARAGAATPAEPAAAPPAALSLAPLPNTSLGSSGLGAPQATGRPTDLGAGPRGPSGLAPMHPPPPPQQQSAIGAPLDNRPQAPPPPSVLAQLVQQNPYLPQQVAALRQAQQGAPQSALYSGFG